MGGVGRGWEGGRGEEDQVQRFSLVSIPPLRARPNSAERNWVPCDGSAILPQRRETPGGQGAGPRVGVGGA